MAVLTHTPQATATSTTAGTTLGITSLAGTIPIGDTVFVIVNGTSISATCVDNSANAGAANVWTQDALNSSASSVNLWVFRSNLTRSLSTTTTITITFSASVARRAAVCFSTHGWVTPAAVERTAQAFGTASPVSTGTTTATSKPDEFVLAAYALSTTSAAVSYTDTGGMTKGAIATAFSVSIAKCATYAWKETSATGVQAGSGTISSSGLSSWAGVVLTYPAAASGTLFTKTVTGAVSFSGIRPGVAMQTKRTGVLAFSGSEVSHPTGRLVTGVFAPAGSLARQSSLARTLAAALTFSGSRSAATAYARTLVGGVLHPTGVMTTVKAVSKAVSGALSFSGSQSHQARKALTGAFTPTGSLARALALLRTITASFAPTATLSKLTNRRFSGAASWVGMVVTSAKTSQFFATLRPTGSVTNGLPARTFFAVFQPVGNARIRTTFRLLTSALIASGVMHTQYLPPIPAGEPGGGGYGALMDDSHFKRYRVTGAWQNVKRVKAK